MDPLKASALFVAYTSFRQAEPDSPRTQREAVRYALANWSAFLPVAHEGWGRLLLRIAKMPAIDSPALRGAAMALADAV